MSFVGIRYVRVPQRTGKKKSVGVPRKPLPDVGLAWRNVKDTVRKAGTSLVFIIDAEAPPAKIKEKVPCFVSVRLQFTPGTVAEVIIPNQVF